MNKRNYQNELEQVIGGFGERVPSLLLHSCCAPCSSYVLEYLSNYFAITVFYYNPNIYPPEEYDKRVEEQRRLIASMNVTHPISFRAAEYRPEEFYDCVRGMEKLPEGGARCRSCYELRIREAAKLAAADDFDYFTTTLSISPMKRSEVLNEVGEKLAGEYQADYLPSDFKKRGGYQRSVELSLQHGLYRQSYCGCVYSKKEQEERQKDRTSS